jgi:membrane associated rhomboid family serine protease
VVGRAALDPPDERRPGGRFSRGGAFPARAGCGKKWVKLFTGGAHVAARPLETRESAMGIYDRDYYRREGPSFLGSFAERGTMCKWLIAVNVAAFIVQMVTVVRGPRGVLDGWFTEALCLDASRVLHGEVWRLLTYAFLHSTSMVDHILWNMLFLFLFGRDVEDMYGPREFLTFYLVSAVAGGVAHVALVQIGWFPLSVVVGASGAVTAVLVLCAFHYPTRIILLFLILPVPIWLFVIFSVAKDFYSFLGAADHLHVAVDVHLAGAAFAFAYFKLHWRLTDLLPRVRTWQRKRSQPRLRVYREEEAPTPVTVAAAAPPEDEQLEAKMDAILAKISRTGKESLTDSERQLLLRASEVFKRRRR